MRRKLLGCLVGTTLFFTPAAVSAESIKDHPAVTSYPGSVASRRDEDGFRRYNFVIGVNESGTTDTEFLQTLTVEGNVTRLAYENPKERSTDEIFSNYKSAFLEASFEIIFSCIEKECGPAYASSRWSRVTGLRYFSPDMRYLVAKGARDGLDIYVAALVAKRRHQVEIVEISTMETGLVTAKAISEGMLLDGRVVLDGISFDTDKAVLKSESKAALDVISQFLTENKELEVYVVGHTDGTGTYDHNIALSKDRATAVVNALIDDYGIKAERLIPHGIGPLSPQKTNLNEDGRSTNRRVEMVQR